MSHISTHQTSAKNVELPVAESAALARVHAATVREGYSRLKVSLGGTLFIAALVVLMQWQSVGAMRAGIWAALVAAVTVARFLSARRFNRAAPSVQNMAPWNRMFVVMTAIAGAVWGSGAFFLFPTHDIVHQVTFAFVVAGIGGGSVTTLGPHRQAGTLFLSFLVLPLVLRFFLAGSPHHLLMSALVFLFYLGLLASCAHAHQSFAQNVLFRIQGSEREHALRESEDRYRELLDMTGDMILMIDDRNQIIYANGVMTNDLGTDLGDLAGVGFRTILTPTSATLLADTMLELSPQRDSGSLDLVFLAGDGRQVHARGHVGLHNDGAGGRMYRGVFRNISAQKETLANRQKSSRMMGEFLSNMSHELRTPLNAILGLSEALQEGIFGELTEQQRASLKTIGTSGNQLLDTINAILDLARINSKKLELTRQEIELNDFCQTMVPKATRAAQARHQSFCFTPHKESVRVQADPRRLRQMLRHLLDNAIKFTQEEGSIGIKVKSGRDGMVELWVCDNGPGIPAERRAYLFDAFVQGDGELNREFEGSGLGLALVRGLCELHGGSLRLVGEGGEGATFVIAIPGEVVATRCDDEALGDGMAAAAAEHELLAQVS